MRMILIYNDSHGATSGRPESEPGAALRDVVSERVDDAVFCLPGSARFVTFSPHVCSTGPHSLFVMVLVSLGCAAQHDGA